jgi:hypothetical protein
MLRECDPDRCVRCGAGVPADEGDIDAGAAGADAAMCQNVGILMGRPKQLVIAESTVHGWGCFLKHDAKKDDFVTEYLGEKISNVEGTRRGKLYDAKGVSFLFDVDESYCIDAFKKGSKSECCLCFFSCIVLLSVL